MSLLKQLGVISSENSKAGIEFERIFPDFLQLKDIKPSEYINELWTRYKENDTNQGTLNGKIFEYLIFSLFIKERILPIYLNARVAFVPNVIYDLLLYTTERGPICLSLKTSLRERYKQADLEAIALKYVHRKSLSFLITLEKKEADSVKQKIKIGDVIGLDKVIVATLPEFDEFIDSLKNFQYSEPPTVKVIESNQIVTNEKVNKLFK